MTFAFFACARKTPAQDGGSVYITIECKTISENIKDFNRDKEDFLPESGYILKDKEVEIKEGDTAFDAIVKACRENHCESDCPYCKNGIQIEYAFTPVYHSYYIEGIHQLYEKDCGPMSGWLFFLNGEETPKASSEYTVKDGDKIEMHYTCSY